MREESGKRPASKSIDNNGASIGNQYIADKIENFTAYAESCEDEAKNAVIPVKFSPTRKAEIAKIARANGKDTSTFLRGLIETALILETDASRYDMTLSKYMTDASHVFQQFKERQAELDKMLLQRMAGSLSNM